MTFESQSAADLSAVGGRLYAAHESTRILCLCCLIDGHFHLWLPGRAIDLPCYADLWPYQFGEPRPLHLWGSTTLPSPIADAVAEGREFVAHNCHEFDEHVWRAKLLPIPRSFGDTIHGCRSSGLPAGLAKLAQRFFGFGKDAGNAVMRKLMTLEWDGESRLYFNRNTTPGNVALVGRYCVADVLVLERVYQEVAGRADADAVRVHREINERGVMLDETLARGVIDFGNRAAVEAKGEVERLTGGELKASDVASPHKVKAWLRSRGLDLKSINKKNVDRLIADPDAFVQELLGDNDDES